MYIVEKLCKVNVTKAKLGRMVIRGVMFQIYKVLRENECISRRTLQSQNDESKVVGFGYRLDV